MNGVSLWLMLTIPAQVFHVGWCIDLTLTYPPVIRSTLLCLSPLQLSASTVALLMLVPYRSFLTGHQPTVPTCTNLCQPAGPCKPTSTSSHECSCVATPGGQPDPDQFLLSVGLRGLASCTWAQTNFSVIDQIVEIRSCSFREKSLLQFTVTKET